MQTKLFLVLREDPVKLPQRLVRSEPRRAANVPFAPAPFINPGLHRGDQEAYRFLVRTVEGRPKVDLAPRVGLARKFSIEGVESWTGPV